VKDGRVGHAWQNGAPWLSGKGGRVISSTSELRLGLLQMPSWPARRWAVGLIVAAATGLLTGVPTDIVPTPIFQRMTPVTWWDYPIWAATALLVGLIAATYVQVDRRALGRKRAGRVLGSGLLTVFAVGCPICNKLVVAALGVSGALSYFGPIQPFLGLASLALLAATLTVRLRGLAACSPTPAP